MKAYLVTFNDKVCNDCINFYKAFFDKDKAIEYAFGKMLKDEDLREEHRDSVECLNINPNYKEWVMDELTKYEFIEGYCGIEEIEVI